MANNKEIRDRIDGIRDTRKITNAMYLIASSKLRKAKANYANAEDYFRAIRITIRGILEHMEAINHRYLETEKQKLGKKAYIVVTSDKGLAGAYNQNVIKYVEEILKESPDAKLYVIGQIGRIYFSRKHPDNYQSEFLYSAQHPSLQRARSITAEVLHDYRHKEISEVHIIYTVMKNALQSEVNEMQMLPLSRDHYFNEADNQIYHETGGGTEAFFPDAVTVLNEIVPISMQGIIFSAMTESYCSELNDRMAAMDSASKSADDMIANLELVYNRTRQGDITQEITEVIGGAKAQKKKKLS